LETEQREVDFDALNQRFEDASPAEILRWSWDTFADKLAIVTSFQPTGIVALSMLRTIAPRISVLTIDTGLLFESTYQFIDQIVREWDLDLVRICPEQTPQEQAETYGDALWQRDPNLCCQLRKVIPLKKALTGYQAWITGLRRDQSESRRATRIVAWDARHENVKISPFARWTEGRVWAYLESHGLPYNPLHDQNYTSIGCQPCTRAVTQDEDNRAGRWSGSPKIECGIHLPDPTRVEG